MIHNEVTGNELVVLSLPSRDTCIVQALAILLKHMSVRKLFIVAWGLKINMHIKVLIARMEKNMDDLSRLAVRLCCDMICILLGYPIDMPQDWGEIYVSEPTILAISCTS